MFTQLASHIRAALCGRDIIILDLRSNKYISITGEAAVYLPYFFGLSYYY